MNIENDFDECRILDIIDRAKTLFKNRIVYLCLKKKKAAISMKKGLGK